jgi:hypothetical protein
VHAHKDRAEADERAEHDSAAHVHDHAAPAGDGRGR